MTWLFWLAIGALVGGFVGLSNLAAKLPADQIPMVADALTHVFQFSGIVIVGNGIVALAAHYWQTR